GGPRRVQHGNASAAVVLFVGAQFSGYRARSVPGQAARPRRWRSADVLVPRAAAALGRPGRGRACAALRYRLFAAAGRGGQSGDLRGRNTASATAPRTSRAADQTSVPSYIA